MSFLRTAFNTLAKVLFLRKRLFLSQGHSSQPFMGKICYAITVCDEHEELSNLLNLLAQNKRECDEILIQSDEGNTTPDVKAVLSQFKDIITKIVEFPLANNYSQFKNNLIRNTSCDYIFQVDADELPSPFLLQNLPTILSQNSEVEAFKIPRINIMIDNDMAFFNWDKISEDSNKKFLNYPDLQKKLFKNNGIIHWEKPIHESIRAYKTITILPLKKQYSILHCKKWSKQEKRWESTKYDESISYHNDI